MHTQCLDNLRPYFFSNAGNTSPDLDLLLDQVLFSQNPGESDNIPQHQQAYQRVVTAVNELFSRFPDLDANKLMTIAPGQPHSVLLPAFIAQVITTFSISDGGSAVTREMIAQMQTSIAQAFSRLFSDPRSDGNELFAHLTGSSATANYEAIWNLRAIKYYPVAIAEALKNYQIDLAVAAFDGANVSQLTLWQLTNMDFDAVHQLNREALDKVRKSFGEEKLVEFCNAVKMARLESLGAAGFFANHWKLSPPRILVGVNQFEFWKNALRLLGLGSRALVKVPVDAQMKMDTRQLSRILEQFESQKVPVLALIGNLGDRDFGAVDPVAEITDIRDQFAKRGFYFPIHLDATYGGQLVALLAQPQFEETFNDTLPANVSTTQLKALKHALPRLESISTSTHHDGYLPQDLGVLLHPWSSYSQAHQLVSHSTDGQIAALDYIPISPFIDSYRIGINELCTSYLTYKTLPLDNGEFGQLIAASLAGVAAFNKRLQRLSDEVKIRIQQPYDSQLWIAPAVFNLKYNRSLKHSNDFNQALMKRMQQSAKAYAAAGFDFKLVRMSLGEFSNDEKKQLLSQIGINRLHEEKEQQELVMLSFSLSNPWLTLDGEEFLQNFTAQITQDIAGAQQDTSD